jgi:hypothetical protein
MGDKGSDPGGRSRRRREPSERAASTNSRGMPRSWNSLARSWSWKLTRKVFRVDLDRDGELSGCSRQRDQAESDSFGPPTRCRFALAFAHSVALTFNDGHLELLSDRADFPVLGIEQVANLSLRFQIEHPAPPLQRYGSTNRPRRPQTMQRSQPENHGQGLSGRRGLRKAIARGILWQRAERREDGSVTLFCATRRRRRYAR